MGLVERKGRAVSRATKDATGATLLPLMRDYVLPESTVYTDEWKSYGGIQKHPQARRTEGRISTSAYQSHRARLRAWRYSHQLG